jgi:hypothetical protein
MAEGRSEKIISDLPAKIDSRFASAFDTRLVEATTSSWNFWFGLLEDYKDRFSDCNVPQGWSENLALGQWCRGQRKAFTNGELSAERIARLEKIGFRWKPH